MVVSRGLETASASIVVTVASSVVHMVTVRSDRTSWNHGDKMIFHAVVSGSNANIDYEWKVRGLFGKYLARPYTLVRLNVKPYFYVLHVIGYSLKKIAFEL